MSRPLREEQRPGRRSDVDLVCDTYLEASDLALYEDLRRRRGGRGELCQACRVTLPTSKVQQDRQGEELTLW